MAIKFVVLFACIAAASAGILAPAVAPLAVARVEEYDPHPQYSYGYDVQDALTGDSKNHVESRDGGLVSGQYSLNDADGYRRIVDYTADPINGFNAVVRREPLAYAVKAVAAVPALLKAAPAPLAYAAQPLSYAAAPSPLAYSAGPSPFAYSAGPAALRTSFSSPLISYAY